MPNGDTIIRFTRSERFFHNMVMVCFITLLVTGLVMLIYNLLGHQGGMRWLAEKIHKLFSLILLTGGGLVLIFGSKSIWVENLRVILTWGRNDFVWMLMTPVAAVIKNIDLPLCDKFNPGQKFWALNAISGVSIQILSGAVLWLMDTPLLAVFIHTAVAIFIIPLLMGHIFMAAINPATRHSVNAIISGRVNREWATKHYPLWVKRKQGEE